MPVADQPRNPAAKDVSSAHMAGLGQSGPGVPQQNPERPDDQPGRDEPANAIAGRSPADAVAVQAAACAQDNYDDRYDNITLASSVSLDYGWVQLVDCLGHRLGDE